MNKNLHKDRVMQTVNGITASDDPHTGTSKLQEKNNELQAQIEALNAQIQSQRESYNTLKHHAEQVVNNRHSQAGELNSSVEKLAGVIALQNQAGSYAISKEEISHIDDALIAKGMIPMSSILKESPIEAFMGHVGVDSMVYFERWLTMRLNETIKYKSMMIAKAGGPPEDDEMFEWAMSHAAVYQEVMVNFRNAKAKHSPNAH
jgi:hypothetical protein